MTGPPRPFRYAVYFCPDPDSEWGKAGAQWLGRCAFTGKRSPQIQLSEIDPEILGSLTAEPKRYGWHATLKAPFQLAPGYEVGDLHLKLHQLARSLKPFDLPKLEVSTAGGFLSLRPCEKAEQLDAVAAACVKDLQGFALPLTLEELTRRRKANLTPDQDKLLVAWGYPWVLDQFRFHFSLTGSLHAVASNFQKILIGAAQQHFEKLGVCRFDRISLLAETQAGQDFEVVKWFELYP